MIIANTPASGGGLRKQVKGLVPTLGTFMHLCAPELHFKHYTILYDLDLERIPLARLPSLGGPQMEDLVTLFEELAIHDLAEVRVRGIELVLLDGMPPGVWWGVGGGGWVERQR